MRIGLTGLGSGALAARAGQTFPNAGGRAASTGMTSIWGWVITESTGAAVAKVRFRDGTTVAAEIIATITVPANGISLESFARGLSVYNADVFYEVVSGSVEGSLEVS